MGTTKNGWALMPKLHPLDDMLPMTCQVYRKDNLNLLYDQMEHHPDGLWKHASLSLHHRYPTWDEILDVRYTFFEETDEVFQVLPPKGEYINIHKNCFHLWSPVGRRVTPG